MPHLTLAGPIPKYRHERHAISRIARTLRRLVNQDVARTNAAGASAVLQERRDEHDDVNAYLDALARDGGHPPEVARS